jgi:flagellin-specific chaperone FliS
MKFPWKVEKKPLTTAEEKLEEIKNILFPPLELHEEISKEGDIIKYHVDYSVDSNIDAALIDLYDGNNDQVVQSTLNKAAARLNKVRRLLEAYAVFDAEAKYIIVDDGKDDEIQARED